MEDYETSAEAIEARAAALRSKINPLPTGEAHRGMWQDRPAREVVDAAAARIDLPPAPFEDYLGPHALKLGDIAGDGLCQYRAFARATFSNESLHEELRDLAADFLLLNQDTYAGRAVPSEDVRDSPLFVHPRQVHGECWGDGVAGCTARRIAAVCERRAGG
tara:strand:- start:4543 stop:5028 length:486 start_codon:yes stop_codon:yes gene_type:complete